MVVLIMRRVSCWHCWVAKRRQLSGHRRSFGGSNNWVNSINYLPNIKGVALNIWPQKNPADGWVKLDA